MLLARTRLRLGVLERTPAPPGGSNILDPEKGGMRRTASLLSGARAEIIQHGNPRPASLLVSTRADGTSTCPVLPIHSCCRVPHLAWSALRRPFIPAAAHHAHVQSFYPSLAKSPPAEHTSKLRTSSLPRAPAACLPPPTPVCTAVLSSCISFNSGKVRPSRGNLASPFTSASPRAPHQWPFVATVSVPCCLLVCVAFSHFAASPGLFRFL
jgi:hypothetical protein